MKKKTSFNPLITFFIVGFLIVGFIGVQFYQKSLLHPFESLDDRPNNHLVAQELHDAPMDNRQDFILSALFEIFESLPDGVYIRDMSIDQDVSMEIKGMALSFANVDAMQERLSYLSLDSTDQRFFERVNLVRATEQHLAQDDQSILMVEFRFHCLLNYREDNAQQGIRR